MKIAWIYLGFTMSFLILTGCNPPGDAKGGNGSSSPMVASGQEHLTATPNSTAVAGQPFSTAAPISTPTGPSYDEIVKRIEDLAGSKRPVSREQFDEVKRYTQSLEGQQAVSWQGWVTGLSQDDEKQDTYIIWVVMQDPYRADIKDRITDDVVLLHIPSEYVQSLDAYREPKSIYTSWQMIRFTGRIALVVPDLRPFIQLSHVVLEPPS